MNNNQVKFKMDKKLLGRLLAGLSLILSVFSLILFCTSYLNNKSLEMSDTTKALQTVTISVTIVCSVIFCVYYFFFRQKKGFEFIISIGLIALAIVHFINILSEFINLSEVMSKTSKYVDMTSTVVGTVASVVIPLIFMGFFLVSAYLVFKKQSGKLLTFTIIPAIHTAIYFISVPLIASIGSASMSSGAGEFLEFYALLEVCLYCTLFVLGLDLGDEYKKDEAEEAEAEVLAEKDEEKAQDDTLSMLESAYIFLEKGVISEDEYTDIKSKILEKI